jgi:exopolyphosphatase/pppGpp-phosphohydrolase
VTEGRHKVTSASLPVGASLLEAALRGDPPEALSWALRAQQIGAALAAAPSGKPVRAWATGGSAHNLAGIERTRGKRGPQVLTMRALSRLADELLSVPSAKLARRSGEDQARVAILPPGLLIIAAVLEHYELKSLTVVPEGVRDGMILAVSKIGDDWWRDLPGSGAAPLLGSARRRATRVARSSAGSVPDSPTPGPV